MYTVAEYCPHGDLFDLLSKVDSFSEDVARDYFRQALMALRQIHSHGIYHLDVSLENLLLAEENRIVLADFGCARKWAKGKLANFGNYRPGKWQYMCPEIYEFNPVNGEKADIWSIGVCLFIMVTGRSPFSLPSKEDPNFVRFYQHKDFSRCKISEDCKDLLANLLCPSNQRFTISDILRHPWMMFQSHPFFRNPNSRASSPSCRRSLTQISPGISPFTSPVSTPLTLSPREECKAFIMPNIYSVTPRDDSKSFIIPPNVSPYEERSFFIPPSFSPRVSSSFSPQENSKGFFCTNLPPKKNSVIEKYHGNNEKLKTKNNIIRRSYSMSPLEGRRHAFAQLTLPQLISMK